MSDLETLGPDAYTIHAMGKRIKSLEAELAQVKSARDEAIRLRDEDHAEAAVDIKEMGEQRDRWADDCRRVQAELDQVKRQRGEARGEARGGFRNHTNLPDRIEALDRQILSYQEQLRRDQKDRDAWRALCERACQELVLCVEEIEESVEFEGRLASFVAAARKARAVLADYEALASDKPETSK